MQKNTVEAIIGILIQTREHAIEAGRIGEYMNGDTYEFLFKELAKATQGSLLFNENMLDAVCDTGTYEEWMVPAVEMAEKQAGWLRELGFTKLANIWLTNLEEAREIIAA